MAKSIPLPVRFPTDLYECIDDDATRLRRSKASIIVEIIEKHYDNQNGDKPTTKKKAGSR
jgi:predicted DNA-binding protein